ncbi:MAG: GspE/PulE family protein [Candidatus Liptonbacteria bacterium]|nr:GspE/PulE family protein [Candidatus Liptonbacteria bacterium]
MTDIPSPADLAARLAKLKREGEERAAKKMAQKAGVSYVDLLKVPATTDALGLIPEDEARDAKVATIELKARKVAIAVENPELPATKKILKDLETKKYDIRIFVTSHSNLENVWRLYRFVKKEGERITGKVKIEEARIEELRTRLTNFPAIQEEIKKIDFVKTTPIAIVELVIAGAISIGASDIHLESEEKRAKIRLRVDGLLHDVFQDMPLQNYEAIISRLKLISGIKLNVKDVSQDGRFTITVGQKEIEVRVSIIPSEFGENVVLRILDPEATSIGLSSLGLRDDDLTIVEKQIAKPNGLILNTGPTGSGKTTTLYAFLRQVNNPEIKIITLEDPIEYRLPGVEQTQVDAEAGYTFANGLRAIVRQDPDIVLVGEIRDLETADIALQASLTGHLVLSTLHTNDAAGAVPRLVNLGVKTISIGPATNLVIAQRLVRKLCPVCKKAVPLTPESKKKVEKFFEVLPKRVDRKKYQKNEIYAAVGCSSCNGFGYKGRIGIFEFLEGGSRFEETILKEASESALKKLSEEQEMVTMQQDGILKTLAGETSFDEVESVTGKIEW